MGTLLGILLTVVFVVGAALMGFISFEASAIAFSLIAYGLWALILVVNFSLGRAISDSFRKFLNKSELRAFQRYNVHIRASGAGEIFSASLNLLRMAGFVWAGLCIWQGHYVLAGLSAAFFFVSGGIILKTHPFLYMTRQAQAGNDVAVAELGAIQSLKVKRDHYLAELS